MNQIKNKKIGKLKQIKTLNAKNITSLIRGKDE
jgi:hypothetical protein